MHKELNIERLLLDYLEHSKSVNLVSKSFRELILLKNTTKDKSIRNEIIKALQSAYNSKYGNWDTVNDLRLIDYNKWFYPVIKYTNKLHNNSKILSIGVNDGRELCQIFKTNKSNLLLDVVDISNVAIEKSKINLQDFKTVNTFVGDFEFIDLIKQSYNMIISLRTINSSGINIYNMINKCNFLLSEGGSFIISVSNGYIKKENNKLNIVKGMYNYNTNKIDTNKPYDIVDKIVIQLNECNFSEILIKESFSEIFIIAKKSYEN